MRKVTITCDKCGLLIEPPDISFKGHNLAGAESLVVLDRVNGGIGHNRVPLEGWHFHYLCFSAIVTAIENAIKQSSHLSTT